MNWYKKSQINLYLGYKIVGVKRDTNQPYSIYSKEPVDVTIGKTLSYGGKGLFLGTSKKFCMDYYSCGTEDKDGEMILTYQYSSTDIIKGDPSHPNGEVQVSKATLTRIEPINKEEEC